MCKVFKMVNTRFRSHVLQTFELSFACLTRVADLDISERKDAVNGWADMYLSGVELS